jgi:SAM-dependent methyltransferase
MADLRFPGGASLPGSPIDLGRTLQPHKRKLKELMFSAPFRVDSFRLDGRSMDILGAYHPMTSSLDEVSILLDGAPPAELIFVAFDRKSRHDFWFLDPRSLSFRARFDVSASGPSERDAFMVSVLHPREPLNPLRYTHIPVAQCDFTNIPDANRMRRVSGHADGAKFVLRGRTHFQSVRSLAERHGMPLTAMTRVLDWGVGCGRIARHVLHLCPQVELHGIDIDADNIAWCAANLPGGHFAVGPLMPPLPFPDDYFDFIYANSVFTHLTEAAQNCWLAELARVLRPDGKALATVHGETSVAYQRLPLDWIARWTNRGIDDDSINPVLMGVIADERYYRNTFHTANYIRRHWNKWVDVRAIEKHIIVSQDAVIFTKNQSDRPRQQRRP